MPAISHYYFKKICAIFTIKNHHSGQNTVRKNTVSHRRKDPVKTIKERKNTGKF